MSRKEQTEKMTRGPGFVAALDQSGGSTPKALKLYGIDEDAYDSDTAMFDLIHEMRCRIMQSPVFTGEFGNAFLTAHTMRSPTPAVRLVYLPRAVEPPRTLMTNTSLAPLLSATSNLDSF